MVYEKNIDLSIFQPYKINCEKCSGLCCVALYFTKSDGFPKDKEAGAACKNLLADYKCKVHSQLSQMGLKGCLAYDCFGAGQYVTGLLKTTANWTDDYPKEAKDIFGSYLAVMSIHQTLWYLSQCLALHLPQPEKEPAKAFIQEGRSLIEKPIKELAVLDAQPFQEKSNAYLKQICNVFQKASSDPMKMQARNYMGKNMRQKNLAGKDFCMSLLIAADLEQANLYGANFLGADMRDTNIQNTDLSQCLFLTQIQINGAKGNHATVLPPYLDSPKAWDL